MRLLPQGSRFWLGIFPALHLLERSKPSDLGEVIVTSPRGQDVATAVSLGLRRTFQWSFIIADTKDAIIGADLLHHTKIIIDIGNQQNN